MPATHLFSPINQNNGSFASTVGSGIKDFFTSLLPFGNLIDTGIGLISGISNNVYDRNLQQQLFQRDDTTLDRTMQAYKRNGINPLMALPNATAGNTKGFEPSPIQSNFNQSYLNYMQKEQLNLSAEKMRLENGIAREELTQKKLNNDLERSLLKAKINANYTNFIDYYSDLGDRYKEMPHAGYGVDIIPMSEKEKLVRSAMNLMSGDPYPEETKKKQQMEQLVKDGKIKKDPDGNAYIFKSHGQDFYLAVQPNGDVKLIDQYGRTHGDFNKPTDAMKYADDFIF